MPWFLFQPFCSCSQVLKTVAKHIFSHWFLPKLLQFVKIRFYCYCWKNFFRSCINEIGSSLMKWTAKKSNNKDLIWRLIKYSCSCKEGKQMNVAKIQYKTESRSTAELNFCSTISFLLSIAATHFIYLFISKITRIKTTSATVGFKLACQKGILPPPQPRTNIQIAWLLFSF